MRRMLSSVIPAICGVRMTLGSPHSGLSGGRGWSSNTSSAAPAICPPVSARISAAVSTTGPRETFTSTAPGFIRAMRSALIAPRVSSVSGQHSTSTSAPATRSSSVTARTVAGRLSGRRVQAITSIPKPWAMRCSARPILPNPRMPSRLGPRSRPASAWARPAAQPRLRRSPSIARNPRSNPMAAKITCSATVAALAPGTFATSTPAAVAASTGIMSSPAPWRRAARNCPALRKYSGGTGARTISTSAPVPSASMAAAVGAEATR